jgi:hypothetical protein
MRSLHEISASLALVAAASAVGCAEAPELGESESEIRNGTVVNPWDANAFRYSRSIVKVGGCTGTVVQRRWVLTAKHCGFSAGATVSSVRPTSTVSRTVDRVATHPTLDVVLLHITQDMPTDVPSATPYAGTEESLYGTQVACYGYGAKAAAPPNTQGNCPSGTWLQGGQCLTPSAELRTGTLTASNAGPGYFATSTNAAGQMILPGDSGGPCFRGDALAGVNSWWQFDLSGGGQTSAPAFRTWFERTLYPSVVADYDRDQKTDLALWRPSTGQFFVFNSSSGTSTASSWGQSGDVPVLGDYDGDGKTDHAVWRPNTGRWFVQRSSNGTSFDTQWGISGDVPVPGDYDGDGLSDLAVWRPSNGTWFVIGSVDGVVHSFQWGEPGDIPVPGDYDGDMRTDPVVWRPSNGTWYVVKSSDSSFYTTQWGQIGDAPVAGDFNGDGLRDPAVFRPSEGKWYILPTGSTTGGYWQGWGSATDARVPGDYNFDGKTDVAIFRASDHSWQIWLTDGGAYTQGPWGEPGDIAMATAKF